MTFEVELEKTSFGSANGSADSPGVAQITDTNSGAISKH